MNPAKRPDTPEAPHSFGRYRIRGVLGEGGMGRLYVAEQTGIEGFAKIVALKCILPHLADSLPFRNLFLNEARIAARLEHPNIVATYELGEVDGTYFMALEYLPGEDLAAVMARCRPPGGMPIEVAALLVQQSANGLHYAHQMHDGEGRAACLVHRDVNPSNIFITYHGMVKLLDFGVVKAASTRTSPGIFKGKYAYSAPEQLKGESVDHRTDVFSLGIVLWECLTGRRLFDSPTDAGTIDAVRSLVIVPPGQIRSDVPGDLGAITMRALVRDRDGRYQSAHDLSEALDHFLGDQRLRPTSNSLGQWLRALFGNERAALKRAIAQGNDVEGALARLSEVDKAEASPAGTAPPAVRSLTAVRPRPLWSTSAERGTTAGPRRVAVTGLEGKAAAPPAGRVVSVVDASPAPAAPALAPRAGPGGRSGRPRRWTLIVAAAVVLAAVVPLGLLLSRPARQVEAPSAFGGIAVESEPPGAHILVDGDPSGFVTPAVLRHLPVGRTVQIGLDRGGYGLATRRIEVLPGEPRRELFRLTASSGSVRLDGVPRGATVYVDDALVDAAHPLALPLGIHRLRVEGSEDVVFSATIDVRGGEQTVRVRAEGRSR
jgi:eukaryotic-like serine/threonine-protein kinase